MRLWVSRFRMRPVQQHPLGIARQQQTCATEPPVASTMVQNDASATQHEALCVTQVKLVNNDEREMIGRVNQAKHVMFNRRVTRACASKLQF